MLSLWSVRMVWYIGEKPIDLFVFDKGMVYFCKS